METATPSTLPGIIASKQLLHPPWVEANVGGLLLHQEDLHQAEERDQNAGEESKDA